MELTYKQISAIRKAIIESKPPLQCSGGDEYGCGGYKDASKEEEESTECILKAILEVMKEW